MTERDLDRLVSKTEMNPLSKKALRQVRKAVVSGRVGDPNVGSAHWSVSFDNTVGSQVKMSFSFKRDTNGS